MDVTATHFAPLHLELGAHDLMPSGGELTLRTAEPRGVLRGLVRYFDGNPVRASVQLEPGASTTQSEGDGSFEVELAPGMYSVRVEAPGFESQSRAVSLSDGHVTIFVFELREDR